MKVDWSNYKYANLFDVCEVERAKRGKTYKAGSTLIPLSGMISTPLGYLKEDGEVEVKYAVCTPKPGMYPLYIHEVIKYTFEAFKSRYVTTINLQYEALRRYEVPIHPTELQKKGAAFFKFLAETEEQERKRLEHMQNLKKNMLDKCFV